MVNTDVRLCGMESNWHQLTPDSLGVAPRRIEQRKVSENGMQLVTIGDTCRHGEGVIALENTFRPIIAQ